MKLLVALSLLAPLALSSCDKRPSAPTTAQNQQLDETEKLLDEMATSEATNAN